MRKLITALALATTPLLLIAPDAQAHERHAKHYYHERIYYRGHMPRWLRRHHDFNGWYRHSGLRGNTRLGWNELFSIYRMELRFGNYRRAHRYHRGHHREFRYYRQYWNAKHASRDRHRYGERKNQRKDRGGKKRDKRRHS